jgi:hypothetical protein
MKKIFSRRVRRERRERNQWNMGTMEYCRIEQRIRAQVFTHPSISPFFFFPAASAPLAKRARERPLSLTEASWRAADARNNPQGFQEMIFTIFPKKKKR